MTMTKKRKKTIRRPVVAKARRYTPRPCTNCTTIRPDKKNYSEVYSTFSRTDGVYRYCRCTFCGNTWMSSETHKQNK